MPISTDGTINSSLIGAQFEPDTLEVNSELTEKYALAVNDDNPRYLNRDGSSDIVAPPIFGIVPVMRILRSAMANGTLPLSVDRTVHGEQAMTFISPIRPGDVLVSSAHVRDVNENSSGTTVDIEISTNTRDGVARVNQVLTAFIRNTESIGSPQTPTSLREDPLHEVVMNVTPDQSIRYAKASFTEGIKPHEDPEAARALGYRTMFLQGQCTMAFAAKAITDAITNGDPTRLKAIKVRFAQVVYPSEALTTRIWRGDEPGQYSFDTIKEDGTLALANGLAEIGDI